ncbi:MAG: hypothetical protein ACYDH9_11555 [Limisphaerales bacterium]
MRSPPRASSDTVQTEQDLEFAFVGEPRPHRAPVAHLERDLAAFHEFGKPTRILRTTYPGADGAPTDAPTFVNEFWTSKQRAANRLHEIL